MSGCGVHVRASQREGGKCHARGRRDGLQSETDGAAAGSLRCLARGGWSFVPLALRLDYRYILACPHPPRGGTREPTMASVPRRRVLPIFTHPNDLHSPEPQATAKIGLVAVCWQVEAPAHPGRPTDRSRPNREGGSLAREKRKPGLLFHSTAPGATLPEGGFGGVPTPRATHSTLDLSPTPRNFRSPELPAIAFLFGHSP